MASTRNENLNIRLEGCKSLFEGIEKISKEEDREKDIGSKVKDMFLFCEMLNVAMKTRI